MRQRHDRPRSASKIELKQLRHAVTAADYGSFRKASEALNVQQSSLSRSIRQLEHATSSIIFDRSPGGVVLSVAGKKVIAIARTILDQLDMMSFPNVGDASGRGSKLCIGFCTSLSTGALRAALVDFRKDYPEVQVKALERSRTQLSTALQNGTIDVIISTGNLSTGAPSSSQVLWSERVLLAVPTDHALAKQQPVYWTDLRNQKLLMSLYDPYWELEQLLVSKLVSAEDRPTIEHHDVSRGVLKSLVSMKLGLGLMLESDIGISFPEIVYRELHDGAGASRVGFSVFWDATNENPALTNFLKLLSTRYPFLPAA